MPASISLYPQEPSQSNPPELQAGTPHRAEVVQHPAWRSLREAPAERGVLAPVLKKLRYKHGAVIARFRRYELSSAFQPIYSFAHQKPVGCEALLRAVDPQGRSVPPTMIFDAVKRTSESVCLDRLCRTMHIANFQALDNRAWLFLNVNPLLMANGRKMGSFFPELLEHFGLPAHQIVVEILETAIPSETLLEESISFYRELGCMVAVDDFGAGHSNFERIWRLQPDIVKLDRKMLAEAVNRDVIRRSLPSLVALLHEAGCIVLAEGIENETEALIAMDANVDLAQGYLFARPSPISAPAPIRLDAGHRVHQRFKQKCIEDAARNHQVIAPVVDAFEKVARQFAEGANPDPAIEDLLKIDGALRFYTIDREGLQADHNRVPRQAQPECDRRLGPLTEARGATWYHRPYFRRALSNPGELQVTGPYLSLPDAKMCLTFSKAVEANGELRIVCFDIASR